jgi:hypothetical protein
MDTTELSVISNTTAHNIRKLKRTALEHIRGKYLPVVMFRYKIQTNEKYKWLFARGYSTSFWERLFAATHGEDNKDYYPRYEVDKNTKEDTLRYIEYYNRHVMDFVEITKDYRAQEQRMRDNTARLKDEKRRYNEIMEKKKKLKKQVEHGNMYKDIISYDNSGNDDNILYEIEDDGRNNSYREWEVDEDAQDI